MVAQANKRPVKLYSEIHGFDGYAAARRIGSWSSHQRLEGNPMSMDSAVLEPAFALEQGHVHLHDAQDR